MHTVKFWDSKLYRLQKLADSINYHIDSDEDYLQICKLLPAASNYHISPATLYPIKAINRCKNPRVYVTLQFFTFFPAIYSTYNGLVRKNRAGFSHVRVCGLSQTDFPQ